MTHSSRYLLASMLTAALLASGCAEHAARPSAPSGTNAGPATTTTTTTHQEAASSASESNAGTETPPAKTGIPACDDYLASYKGCHRAAGIYALDTIDRHYREMRDTLLKESRDPSKRSTLAARCVSLSKLLKQALHGKSCEPAQPAGASSAASNTP